MSADPRVIQLIASYQATRADLRRRVVDFTRASWLNLGQYRDADVDRFVRQVSPVVAGGQRQIAAVTAAYLASLEALVTGRRVQATPVPSELVTTEAIRGTPAATVYRRPGVEVWSALAAGAPLTDAIGRGLTRATSLASTDLQLASTHAARHALTDRPTERFRRITSAHPCRLCAGTAGQTYRTGAVMPIHPGCSCGVEPIFTGHPPAMADTGPADQVDVVVHEHGELGPVLAVVGHTFTGPHDL